MVASIQGDNLGMKVGGYNLLKLLPMRLISIFPLDTKYDNKYILIIILSPLAGCERRKNYFLFINRW